MKITAAVTYEKGSDFVLKEAELDDPKDNEVLIRMVGVGVCHTDALARDQLCLFLCRRFWDMKVPGSLRKNRQPCETFEARWTMWSYLFLLRGLRTRLEGCPFICEQDGIPFRGTYADGTKRLSCEGQNYPAFWAVNFLQLML